MTRLLLNCTMTALLIAGSSAFAFDEADSPSPPPPHEEGHHPGPPPRHRPPRHPLEVALDTDRDGEISAEEISNAAEALKKADRDGDGKLSREELRPPRRPRPRRPGGPRPHDHDHDDRPPRGDRPPGPLPAENEDRPASSCEE